jgi:hypothetical protein
MRLTTTLYSFILIAVLATTTAFTNKSNTTSDAAVWKFLGDKKVSFGVDHDVINFGDGWKDDVRQIKLKVKDGPLKMYSMKIHFDNGSVQDVELRNNFRQGSESRIIDLDGGLRHLTKIEFWYETKGFLRGKARVAVLGRM